jgi:hypothetical protein
MISFSKILDYLNLYFSTFSLKLGVQQELILSVLKIFLKKNVRLMP